MGFDNKLIKKIKQENIKKENDVILCTISKIIKKNLDTGFFTGVAYLNKLSIPSNFKYKNYNKSCQVVGLQENIESFLNYEIECFGQWEHSQKYGSQFKIEYINDKLPTSKDAILTFLLKGKIHGIGKATAKKIVDKYGTSTFDIISNDTTKLLEIGGITKEKITLISESWDIYKETYKIMTFMFANGITQNIAFKIYNSFGNKSISIIESNPYLLTTIQGIGFKTADNIAFNLGINQNTSLRVKAGIQYIISEISSNEGHTSIPYDMIVSETSLTLGILPETVCDNLDELIANEEVLTKNKIYKNKNITFITSPKIISFENNIALKICDLLNEKNIQFNIPNSIISKLDDSQKRAVHNILKSKVAVLTGGPGTGKTFTINSLIDIYQKNNLNVILAAPTGRAAKRMTETTGINAKTIHRLLEYQDKSFKHNETNPLQGDVFIIDESSMIDLYLAFSFVRAIPKNAILIFVGDVNQLPSVGVGNFFEDIINCKEVSVSRLNVIHRQKEGSKIIINSHRIINQQMPILEPNNEFIFIQQNNNEDILKNIINIYNQNLSTTNYSEIQILAPQRTGIVGVDNLNLTIQNILFPQKTKIVFENGDIIEYSIGDKVIQTKNNYNLSVFNGDIGFITDISEENATITVYFDGNNVVYDSKSIREINLGYAITIHKSQGSEYQTIIIPISKSNTYMLNSNILYTGVTRGKSKVYLIGNKETLFSATKLKTKKERFTFLAEEIQNIQSTQEKNNELF